MAVETMVASIAIMNMAAMTEATTSGRRLVGAAGMSAKVGCPRPRGTASEGGSGRICDHDLLQAEEGQPAAAPFGVRGTGATGLGGRAGLRRVGRVGRHPAPHPAAACWRPRRFGGGVRKTRPGI